MDDVLLIFVKYPEPGKVKTRLRPGLSAEQAARISKAMAEDVVSLHTGTDLYDTVICFTPEEARQNLCSWLGGQARLMPQAGLDLGERQANAFRQAFEAGYTRAVIIGTDCIGITPEDVVRAFEALGGADIVVGPSEDGGYYLIGAGRPHEALFDNIDWSTEAVLGTLLDNAGRAGIAHNLLGVKYDVDSFEDVLRLHADLRDSHQAISAGRTLGVLNSIFAAD